ncbi:MAG: SAM-dependent chlorinase/fluorinase [Gammaproteobacteria bacterium]|nr:SAM-dependent chlorinase/fluorinase [Gammaproteobacteria bacterium]MDH5728775.1 SAM-dependent chlorinase/fluorinase [Gammaproteobacteria bacterium]
MQALLFTDFGYQGPYVGQIKSCLKQLAPELPIIDLMHDVPGFNTNSASYLLHALSHYMPEDVFVLAIVDPGVGNSNRRPVAIKIKQRWFIGPENGIFDRLWQKADDSQVYEIDQSHFPNVSMSFHGRDIFAPTLAKIFNNDFSCLMPITYQPRLTQTSQSQVVYIDAFGNVMLSTDAFNFVETSQLKISNQIISFAATFSLVEPGSVFWYKNSIGLVELAVNQGSAAQMLGLSVGDELSI